MRELRERLRMNYLTSQPEEEVVEVARGGVECQVVRQSCHLTRDKVITWKVFTCKADNKIVVCGLLNGTANVYDTQTKCLLTVLDCPSSGGSMRLALSQDVIVAASSHGVISVWSRTDYGLTFRDDTIHQANITGVKVNGTVIMTGDSDGLVVQWTDIAGGAIHRTIFADEKKPVTDLDFQQNILLVGSRSCLRVGSVSSKGDYKSLRVIKTDYVLDCKLSPPLAFTSGGKYREGIQVWDLQTGGLVRTLCSHLAFLSLEISNNLSCSVITSAQLTFPHIHVMDLDRVERGGRLMMRTFPCLQSVLLSPSVCRSDTKIFQAHGTELKMLEFWYYQVSDWDIDTYLDGIKL